MAKITTRKSTTLIHVDRSGVDRSTPAAPAPSELAPKQSVLGHSAEAPAQEPERGVQQTTPERTTSPGKTKSAVAPKIDTTPVVGRRPAPDAQAAAQSMPEVKVERAQRGPNALKPATQPKPLFEPVPRNNQLFLRVVLAGIGLVFFFQAMTGSLLGRSRTVQPLALDNSSELPSDFLMENDAAKTAGSLWKNDEPGFFSKPFRKLCLGHAKSDSCSEAPLHPFRTVYEQVGVELKFPKERQHVIEQTIEYRSKAFALEGK